MDLSLFTSASKSVGIISSALLFFSFVLYTILYVLLLVKYEIPKWQGIDYLCTQTKENWYRLFECCQILAMISTFAYLGIVSTIFSVTDVSLLVYAVISISFTIMFVILSSVHYYVQLTYLKTRLLEKRVAGAEEYTQLFDKSLIISTNILGWTLFFGISCFALIPLFNDMPFEILIKSALFLNGIFCVTGFIGYSINNRFLSTIFFNGMGLMVILIGLGNLLLFLAV